MNPQDQSVPDAPIPASIPSPVAQPVPTSSLSKIPGPIELLKSGWALFTNHWSTLIPILILPTVVIYIGSILNFTDQIGLKVIGVIVSVVGGVLSVVLVPAIVDAVHRLAADPVADVSLNQQYKKGFTYFWSVILVGIIYGLSLFGSFILLIVPAIIVMVYISLYTYTLVIDGKKGFSALTESYSLVRGRWWPVFGRILFLVLVSIIAWAVIAAIDALLSAVFGVPAFETMQGAGAKGGSFGSSFISFIINIIGSAIIGPIAIGYTYKIYTSLKAVRTETVSTSSFKNWLIAFLCVGVVSIIAAIILIPTMIYYTFKNSIQGNLSNPAFMMELDTLNSSTTLQNYFPNGQIPGMTGTSTQ